MQLSMGVVCGVVVFGWFLFAGFGLYLFICLLVIVGIL